MPFTSDALAAEDVLSRSAVAAAMTDPLAVKVKKSLLVFMSISFLSALGSWGPEVVR
jgi:hypothetical protein